VLAQGGAFRSEFGMPVDPAATGLVFWHQVLQLEFDGGGQALRLAGSNGLSLTLGRY
jgi:hypothetical protein